MADFSVGDRVRWSWSGSTAEGRITRRYTDKVTRTLKGSEITRDASEDAPAFLIEQEDGAEVLKSQSEIERA